MLKSLAKFPPESLVTTLRVMILNGTFSEFSVDVVPRHSYIIFSLRDRFLAVHPRFEAPVVDVFTGPWAISGGDERIFSWFFRAKTYPSHVLLFAPGLSFFKISTNRLGLHPTVVERVEVHVQVGGHQGLFVTFVGDLLDSEDEPPNFENVPYFQLICPGIRTG